MKTKHSSRISNRPEVIASIGRYARRKARWILPAVVLTGLAVSFGVWSRAQNANAKAPAQVSPKAQDIEPPMTPERELSLLEIQKPVEFEAEMQKRMTKAHILEEQKAAFAIGQPAAYSAEFEKFKDNARRDLEQQTRFAILKPVEHRAQFLKNREKRQEQEEEQAARQMVKSNWLRPGPANKTAPTPGQP